MAERTSKLKLSQFTAAEEDSTLFQTWSRNLNSPQGNNDLKKIDDFAADVLDVKLPEKADKPKGTELTDLEGKVPVFDADGNLHNSTVSIGSTIEAGGDALIKASVLKQRFSEMDTQKADKEYVDRAIASVAETAVTTTDEINALKSDLSDLRTKEFHAPENIFNAENATLGYMTLDGNIRTSSSLKYTEKIHVSEGDVIRVYRNESGLSPFAARFITAFNENTAIASKGAENSSEYTVPSGITSVVLTIYAAYVIEITKNSIPTEYSEYFTPYITTTVNQNVLPKASETDFGVAKMWVTIDEDGNKVLNINTGDENE